jgi:nitronate monooxygenase
MILERMTAPIVLAPMAGGPSAPALCAAVTEAGGLGLLAGAYRAPAGLADDIAATRALTPGPFGVNLFVPRIDAAPERDLRAYVERLGAEGERYGVAVGAPRDDDDDGWDEKVALLLDARIAVASFTFGCPPPQTIAALRSAGTEAWVTVNCPEEAEIARDAGADALVVQGVEAGGHQGGWLHPGDPDGFGLLALLRVVASRVDLPLVAAGGLTDGAAVAAALVAGARAAQPGTAFLCADEAGTDPVYRAALARGGATRATRAFSGRTARGLRNRFMDEHGPHAPAAFPAVAQATGPIRAAARAAGDPGAMSLWAGQAHPLASRARPAGEIVRGLVAGAGDALAGASRRLGGRPQA